MNRALPKESSAEFRDSSFFRIFLRFPRLVFLRPFYYEEIIESSAEKGHSLEQEMVLPPGPSPFGGGLAALIFLQPSPPSAAAAWAMTTSCAALKIFPALCIKGPPCVNATHGGPFSQIPPGKSAHRWRAAAISAAAAPFRHGKEV